MRVLLIYYTGTYNTRFLVSKVEERFKEIGDSVEKIEVDADTEKIDVTSFDYIGISYPIYGFNVPHPFIKYLKKLIFKKNQKYFIFKNSGETLPINNASSRKIIRILNKYKVNFCGEYHFIMPYNIHFEFPYNFIRQIIDEDKKLLDIMFYNLEHNICPAIKSKFIYNIGAFFVGIQSFGGNINSFFYKVDKNKCNKCGLCIKQCPHKNIAICKEKIKFYHHCDMCMRCSFYCPKKAIHIGFLERWRVSKYYDLSKMWLDNSPYEPYINKDSKGFYHCFIKSFSDIDQRYDQIASKE